RLPGSAPCAARGYSSALGPSGPPTRRGDMSTPRISYVPLARMEQRMQREMLRCAQYGTPRPESSAVRAHVPACFWSFADSWQAIFREGVCDHAIKELCRLYVSRSVKCEFCGNQRSIKAAQEGVDEAHVD